MEKKAKRQPKVSAPTFFPVIGPPPVPLMMATERAGIGSFPGFVVGFGFVPYSR